VIARAIGAIGSVLTGLFWLGWLLLNAIPHATTGPYAVNHVHAVAFVVVVAPSLACIIGGVQTLRGVPGWRWLPITVCAGFLGYLATAPFKIWYEIFGWDAAIVVLLLWPRPRAAPA